MLFNIKVPLEFNKSPIDPKELNKGMTYLIVKVKNGFNNGLYGHDAVQAGFAKNGDDNYYFLMGPNVFIGKFLLTNNNSNTWNRFQDISCDLSEEVKENFESWDKLGRMEFLEGHYLYFEKM